MLLNPFRTYKRTVWAMNVKPGGTYSVFLSVLDPRKCEYLKDYSLDS